MGKTIKVTAEFKAPKAKKYNQKALREGVKVEGEHTKNKKAASIIAKNHLDEDKNYYKKLRKVEKKR